MLLAKYIKADPYKNTLIDKNWEQGSFSILLALLELGFVAIPTFDHRPFSNLVGWDASDNKKTREMIEKIQGHPNLKYVNCSSDSQHETVHGLDVVMQCKILWVIGTPSEDLIALLQVVPQLPVIYQTGLYPCSVNYKHDVSWARTIVFHPRGFTAEAQTILMRMALIYKFSEDAIQSNEGVLLENPLRVSIISKNYNLKPYVKR